MQLGLDALPRERRVLHISPEHAVDRIHAYRDAILNGLARSVALEGRSGCSWSATASATCTSGT